MPNSNHNVKSNSVTSARLGLIIHGEVWSWMLILNSPHPYHPTSLEAGGRSRCSLLHYFRFDAQIQKLACVLASQPLHLRAPTLSNTVGTAGTCHGLAGYMDLIRVLPHCGEGGRGGAWKIISATQQGLLYGTLSPPHVPP